MGFEGISVENNGDWGKFKGMSEDVRWNFGGVAVDILSISVQDSVYIRWMLKGLFLGYPLNFRGIFG